MLVAVVLSVGMLSWGIAQAASGPNSGTTVTTKNVAGTGAGMPPTAQSLWAVVNPDGTLARGFPKTTTKSSTNGTGDYEVDFYENVDACNYQVTVGQPGTGTVQGYGTADARAGNTKGVFIQTFDSSGNLANLPFHLAVLC
jgi:peptidoglycan hydrolase-like protein with peptidoglycan-binding domain